MDRAAVVWLFLGRKPDRRVILGLSEPLSWVLEGVTLGAGQVAGKAAEEPWKGAERTKSQLGYWLYTGLAAGRRRPLGSSRLCNPSLSPFRTHSEESTPPPRAPTHPHPYQFSPGKTVPALHLESFVHLGMFTNRKYLKNKTPGNVSRQMWAA